MNNDNKQQSITKVLWVCRKLYSGYKNIHTPVVGTYRPELFIEEGCEVTITDLQDAGYSEYEDMIKQKWYKVPAITREDF